jgi:acetyl esterase/lipase
LKKAIRALFIMMILTTALLAVYKINGVRYAAVKAVWNVMDWSSNRSAEKALLPEGVKIEQDISYIKGSNIEQFLDVYYPDGVKNKLPVIIFAHGGGFVAGDKKQTKLYCMTLAKEGYAV